MYYVSNSLSEKPHYLLVENVKGFEVSETRRQLLEMLKDCDYSFQVCRPRGCNTLLNKVIITIIIKHIYLALFPSTGWTQPLYICINTGTQY